jgi:hypothetical protein
MGLNGRQDIREIERVLDETTEALRVAFETINRMSGTVRPVSVEAMTFVDDPTDPQDAELTQLLQAGWYVTHIDVTSVYNHAPDGAFAQVEHMRVVLLQRRTGGA